MTAATPLTASELLDRLRHFHPGVDLSRVELALATVATDPPELRARALSRAATLAAMRLDPTAIAASLLAPRSGPPRDLEALSTAFGEEIAALVQGVDRLDALRWSALDKESAESLRRMFLAIAADVRVVLLTLAEKLERIRELPTREVDVAQRQQIAHETLEVFAPLANRLGIWQMKWELEDRGLRELDPATYAELRRLLAETRAQRNRYVDEVCELLRGKLVEAGVGAEAQITGRPKHLYSIYKKMLRKQVSFDRIYDVSAVRIIVDEVRECYAALGVVHSIWPPIEGEFDDYIARPKDNMYQSLHTAVVGPEGRPLEIQIRTREMHEFAEYGVAAHWAYKERGSVKAGTATDRKVNLLRQLMDWQRELSDPDALAEAFRTGLFEDQVHVFTPRGEVIALPRGATALDFAYRVHTLVGHRCRGALVDDQMVTLQRPLNTGERVEILTKKHPEPSRDWLNPHLGYLTTASARHKVRQWFRRQDRDLAIAAGRELLARELARLGLADGELPDFEALAPDHGFRSADELFAAIGHGDQGTHRIAVAVLDARRPAVAEPPLPASLPTRPRRDRKRAKDLVVAGIGDVLSQPAACCSPVPGDPVVGYISRGRGIVIHRRDCPNVLHSREQERLMEIEWGQAPGQEYQVAVELELIDAPGAIRDVAEVIAQFGINMSSTQSSRSKRRDTQTMRVTLEVRGSDQLLRLLTRLSALDCVRSARRIDA